MFKIYVPVSLIIQASVYTSDNRIQHYHNKLSFWEQSIKKTRHSHVKYRG